MSASWKICRLPLHHIRILPTFVHIQKGMEMENRGEIILYQPDNEVKLEVRIENETVWLTQTQMAELFSSTKQNISLHINNIFKEVELVQESTVKYYLTVQIEGNRTVNRRIAWYNLDVIISVGYRVKSIRGTQFRQWANKVLKDYLLRGYSVNRRLDNLEDRMNIRFLEHEQRLKHIDDKIDFFVRTSLPPVEGIFCDGQIFDAYKFATDLIRYAKSSILLIDNYVDESVLLMMYMNCVYPQNKPILWTTSHFSRSHPQKAPLFVDGHVFPNQLFAAV